MSYLTLKASDSKNCFKLARQFANHNKSRYGDFMTNTKDPSSFLRLGREIVCKVVFNENHTRYVISETRESIESELKFVESNYIKQKARLELLLKDNLK